MYGCLSRAPYWGPGQQPRQCVLIGIELVTPLVLGMALSPLSHTSQGANFYFNLKEKVTVPKGKFATFEHVLGTSL